MDQEKDLSKIFITVDDCKIVVIDDNDGDGFERYLSEYAGLPIDEQAESYINEDMRASAISLSEIIEHLSASRKCWKTLI